MELVETIRQSARIADIASQYTQLQRRGNRLVGLCPFHTEKTPSFSIDEDRQLYHCFGCGAGGDIFTLVMEKENLSFPEAVRYLAEKYRIPIPKKKKYSSQYYTLKDKLLSITSDALLHFKKNLYNTQEGRQALEYMQKRGIQEKTIQHLKLGYAMNSWQSLLDFFQRKNIKPLDLEKAGLVVRRKSGDGFYDRFRGRIIFPIFDLSGRVVAFGGRTVVDDKAKYLNSPETPVYSKGNILYGLNFSKDAVKSQGEIILVEGYTDFLSLYQSGITHAAASLGTSLTPGQAGLANRFCPRMITAYDGDAAGKKATMRAVSLCFEQGMQISVLTLPAGHDPDSFIKKFGAEKMLKQLRSALPGLKFLMTSYMQGRPPRTPEEKTRIVRLLINDIRKIPDAILISEYIKKISEYLEVDESQVRAAIAGRTEQPPHRKSVTFLNAEKRLIQIIFSDSAAASRLLPKIKEEDFTGLASQPVIAALLDYFKHNKKPSIPELKSKMNPVVFSALSEILMEPCAPPVPGEAEDCLECMRDVILENQIKEKKTQLKQLRKNDKRTASILKEIMNIQSHRYQVSQRYYQCGQELNTKE
jgi:DNA primase